MADARPPEPGEDEPVSHPYQGPDRRKSIDLVRVERGEPERRTLPTFQPPGQREPQLPDQED